MKNINKIMLVAIAMALAICLTVPGVGAQRLDTASAQEPIRFQVPLSAHSSIELLGVSVTSIHPNTNSIGLLIQFDNQENRKLNINQYWIHVKSVQGAIFPVDRPVIEGQAGVIVAPYTTQSFVYTTEVSKLVNIEDLIIEVIQWDFSSSNLEKKLAILPFPNHELVVSSGEAYTFVHKHSSLEMTIVDYSVYPDADESYTATITVRVRNIGQRPAELPRHAFYAQTARSATVKLLGEKPQRAIQDNEEISLLLQAPSLQLEDLPLQSLHLLVEASGEAGRQVLVPITNFELPPLADIESSGHIMVEEAMVNTTIHKVTINEQTKDTYVDVFFEFFNSTNTYIELPEYRFMLRLNEGMMYEAMAQGMTQDRGVQPRDDLQLLIKGSLPAGISRNNLLLVIQQRLSGDHADKEWATVAQYALPAEEGFLLGNQGEYELKSSQGLFRIKLLQIHRLPWEDQDLLAADFQIVNLDNQAARIPGFSVTYRLDNKVDTESTTITPANLSTIPANGTVTIQAVASIPYYFTYSSLQLLLTEEAERGMATDTIVFSLTPQQLSAIPRIAYNTPRTLDMPGSRTTMKMLSTQVYTGESHHVLAIQMELANKEKRAVSLVQWAGYVKLPDGSYYPAQIGTAGQKLNPNGKAFRTIWAFIPADQELKSAELIVGQAISDKVVLFGQGSPNGYIRPVRLGLKYDEPPPKSDFEQLRIEPYELSISKVKSTKSSSLLTLDMDYTLSMPNKYEFVSNDYSLIVEVSNGNDLSHEEEFSFGSTYGNTLKLGNGKLNFNVYLSDDQQYSAFSYDLNVYVAFKGERKLLASRRYLAF